MSRSQSSIIKLRKFHNWVKLRLYTDVVDYMETDEINLLELAVGRAGDLYKWSDLKINSVVGFDIDKDSLFGKNGAVHRYKKFRNNNKKHVPDARFYAIDLSKPQNLPKVFNIIKDRKFNLIACQFAIHYFFESPTALDTFMTIVGRSIATGGYFIGTTLDGKEIKKLLGGRKEIESEKYHIKILNNDDSAYNNKYSVSLGDKGEDHYFRDNDSVEFMVDLDELISVAKKHGLKYIGRYPFEEWYKRFMDEDGEKMSESEREFSFLNFSFIFQKS